MSPSSIRHVYRQDNKCKSNSAFESYGVEMWLKPLTVVALSGARRALEDENAVVKGGATCTSLDVWIPGPILRNAVPAVVDTFLRDAPSRMKKAAVATGVYVPVAPPFFALYFYFTCCCFFTVFTCNPRPYPHDCPRLNLRARH
jgi:Holliday junction resolvase YEN1